MPAGFSAAPLPPALIQLKHAYEVCVSKTRTTQALAQKLLNLLHWTQFAEMSSSFKYRLVDEMGQASSGHCSQTQTRRLRNWRQQTLPCWVALHSLFSSQEGGFSSRWSHRRCMLDQWLLSIKSPCNSFSPWNLTKPCEYGDQSIHIFKLSLNET